MVLLDDTYEHHVVNLTDKTRTILFCDIQRPLRQGVPDAINTWVINYLGPLTTRANAKIEKKSKMP